MRNIRVRSLNNLRVKNLIKKEADILSANQKVLQAEINENRKLLAEILRESKLTRQYHKIEKCDAVDLPEKYDGKKLAVSMREEIILADIGVTDVLPDGDFYIMNSFGIMPEGTALIFPYNATVFTSVDGETVEITCEDLRIYSSVSEKETKKMLMRGQG